MSVKSTLVGLAMMVVAALAVVLRPVSVRDEAFQLEQVFPMTFGEWRVDPTVVPLPPSPDVQANLAQIYDQILTRTYVNDAGQRMMFVVAYGGDQSDSLKAHRQEVCYAAQGFNIREVRRDTMAVGTSAVPLVRVHATKGRRSEPISYWFTMGDDVVVSRHERLITQMRHGLAGRIPDGMLVRISSIDGNPQSGYRAHDAFARALLEAVDPRTRQRLAGLREPARAALR